MGRSGDLYDSATIEELKCFLLRFLKDVDFNTNIQVGLDQQLFPNHLNVQRVRLGKLRTKSSHAKTLRQSMSGII